LRTLEHPEILPFSSVMAPRTYVPPVKVKLPEAVEKRKVENDRLERAVERNGDYMFEHERLEAKQAGEPAKKTETRAGRATVWYKKRLIKADNVVKKVEARDEWEKGKKQEKLERAEKKKQERDEFDARKKREQEDREYKLWRDRQLFLARKAEERVARERRDAQVKAIKDAAAAERKRRSERAKATKAAAAAERKRRRTLGWWRAAMPCWGPSNTGIYVRIPTWARLGKSTILNYG
jgi:hypothetical protein